jgi:hypothetical protein
MGSLIIHMRELAKNRTLVLLTAVLLPLALRLCRWWRLVSRPHNFQRAVVPGSHRKSRFGELWISGGGEGYTGPVCTPPAGDQTCGTRSQLIDASCPFVLQLSVS